MKHWFVIFPPGAGGNHLANLLSLEHSFTTRFDNSVYTTQIDSKNKSVHPDIESGTNLDHTYISKNLEQLVNQNTVMCGHLNEYVLFTEQPYFKQFNNKLFFLMKFPEYHTRAFARIEQHNEGKIPKWLYSEVSMMYRNFEILKMLAKESFGQPCVYIETEMLYNENIAPLFLSIKNSLNQFELDLDFDIDMNLVQQTHQLWLQRNYPKGFEQ